MKFIITSGNDEKTVELDSISAAIEKVVSLTIKRGYIDGLKFKIIDETGTLVLNRTQKDFFEKLVPAVIQ